MSREIKNPEKYIKSLKNRIKELEECNNALREDWYKAQGKLIRRWSSWEQGFSVNDFSLMQLRPGDKMVLVGAVIRLEAWKDKSCNNRHSKIIYETTEIRKLE